MPVMEISIVPLGSKTVSVSKYVTKAIKVLKGKRDIKYRLTAMGTIIEAGSIEELLRIAQRMHNSVLAGEIKRVVTTIKIDDRRDKQLTIKGKLKSIKNKLRI